MLQLKFIVKAHLISAKKISRHYSNGAVEILCHAKSYSIIEKVLH
jgi:hypothetical protein